MKVINGHLTAGNKKVVKYMLEKGIGSGKTGNTSYVLIRILDAEGAVYRVEVYKKDRGLVPVPGSALRMSKYEAIIKLQTCSYDH